MSYLLHPPLLDEVGLPSALKWYVEGFEERSGIKVEFDIGSDFGRLSHEMETALFRVAQESLTNIHKHSGSATAQIWLGRDAERIVLGVADHGMGIPSTRLRDGVFVPGVGLMGIRERVQQFGGNAEIVSSAAGTTVTATIPVRP